MATALSSLETIVRRHLKEETTAAFWSSAELTRHFNDGIKNLWGAIIDLYEEHYLTVDESNVSLAANSSTLTGVPTDVFKVHLIEPRDTTSTGAAPHTLFIPRNYNDPEFINARAMSAQNVGNGLKIYFHVTSAGAPVAAPTIRVAPQIASALTLRFAYIPTLATKSTSDDNPVPGESDQALIAYCMAWALAKEQEDKMPHPGWLQIYKTEKDSLLVRLSPRQEQEQRVVEDMWAPYNEDGSYL